MVFRKTDQIQRQNLLVGWTKTGQRKVRWNEVKRPKKCKNELQTYRYVWNFAIQPRSDSKDLVPLFGTRPETWRQCQVLVKHWGWFFRDCHIIRTLGNAQPKWSKNKTIAWIRQPIPFCLLFVCLQTDAISNVEKFIICSLICSTALFTYEH